MSTIAASISPKLLELQTSNLVHDFVWVMLSGRTNNFPYKWAWPRSRDPTIIGIRSNMYSKLFELVTLNLVSGFDLSFDCRVLHTIVYCEAVRSAILSRFRVFTGLWFFTNTEERSKFVRLSCNQWNAATKCCWHISHVNTANHRSHPMIIVTHLVMQ